MKRVVFIGDGMSDHAHAQLGGLTPLAAASTPCMDALAARGVVGRAALTPRGFEPGTDVCHLNLFGYRPNQYYTGRASMEAVGMGLRFPATDGVCRLNLVTVSDTSGELEHFGAGYISSEEARPLVDAIRAGLPAGVELHFNERFHHVLRFVGRGDAAAATRTRPPHQCHGRSPEACAAEGPLAPLLGQIAALAREVLAEHPVNVAREARGLHRANAAWPWSCGRGAALLPFASLWGLSAGLVTGVSVLHGIGDLAEMSTPRVRGVTPSVDNDYAAQSAAVLALLGEVDVVFAHVDAPDEMSHLGDVLGKVESIERFDAELVGPVVAGLNAMGSEFAVTVLPDHATLVQTGAHAADPVPWLHYRSASPALRDTLPYNEEAAAAVPVLEIEEVWSMIYRGAWPRTGAP